MASFRQLFSHQFSLEDPYYKETVLKVLGTMFHEDTRDGDITTEVLDLTSDVAKAVIYSKSHGIVAGIEEVSFFITNSSFQISFETFTFDGQVVQPGQKIFSFRGKAGDILKLERSVLNFLQRLSGIATFARQFTECVRSGVIITPTRKTLWGVLDKKACSLGGCGSHRINLGEAILVKDTHRTLMNDDIEKIMRRAALNGPQGKFFEIEVENEKDALTALKTFQVLSSPSEIFSQWPFGIMLDNMSPSHIKTIVTIRHDLGLEDKVFLEASGGITLQNIQQYAMSGVDVISIGALTHSAIALDFSLKIEM